MSQTQTPGPKTHEFEVLKYKAAPISAEIGTTSPLDHAEQSGPSRVHEKG